jgi:cation:H+ antiporter
MSAEVFIWLKFAACATIIFFAGTKLAQYGDIIAERTGLGRNWVGLILIAIITSTPEVVASVSSVTLVDLPNLSIGNILGSCMFNLTLLALADIMYRPAPVLSRISPNHIMSASFSILLITIVAISILVKDFAGLEVAQMGVPSIIIMVIYVISVWWIFRRERNQQHNENVVAYPEYEKLSSRTVYMRFAISAIVIIAAAIWLSLVGDEIVRIYGMDASFVGTAFVAITTSLPEMMVTIAAIRMGAPDMAAANILGSNMFNVAIMTIADGVYRKGPIILTLSRVHLITTLVTIAMTLVVICGIRFPAKQKPFRLVSWHSLALVALYVFGAYSVFYSLFFA